MLIFFIFSGPFHIFLPAVLRGDERTKNCCERDLEVQLPARAVGNSSNYSLTNSVILNLEFWNSGNCVALLFWKGVLLCAMNLHFCNVSLISRDPQISGGKITAFYTVPLRPISTLRVLEVTETGRLPIHHAC